MIIKLFITLLAGSCVLFISFWASLTHLHSLGILDPFSNSAFPWVFTNSFELSWPNYFILYLWGLWTFHQSLTLFTCITSSLLWSILTFLYHILSMSLLLLSFQASLCPFASSMPICLFLWAYDPLFMPLGFNDFLYPLTNSFLPMLLGFFLLLGFPKMSISSYIRANYAIV